MKFVALPVAIASCLGLGWAVFHDSQQRANETVPAEIRVHVAVRVTRPSTQDIAEELELVGSLEAGRDVEIRSRVSGLVRRLSVDLGDTITAGQVLVELDDSQQKEQVRQATAAIRVATAEAAAQQLRVEAVLGERDRQRTLAAKGVSTKQQLEAAESQLGIAKAEQTLALSKVAQAESAVEASRLAVAERRIVSPLSGRVAVRHVQAGDLAKPDVVLLRIVDLQTVRIAIHVGESDYRRLSKGQSAEVSVDTFPEQRFVGHVERLAPVLDPKTRTAIVYVAVDNPESLLKPGMYARVRVVLDRHPDAIVVPLAALVDSPQGPTLFKVPEAGGVVVQVPVVTGLVGNRVVEIREGITLADRVVTLGSHLVKDGERVDVFEGDDPAADR